MNMLHWANSQIWDMESTPEIINLYEVGIAQYKQIILKNKILPTATT